MEARPRRHRPSMGSKVGAMKFLHWDCQSFEESRRATTSKLIAGSHVSFACTMDWNICAAHER